MKKLVAIAIMMFLSGCAAHGGLKPATRPVKPVDPVVEAKKEFRERYGFFITDKDKVSYYQEVLGITEKEKKIFEGLKTLEDIGKFKEVFWKIRDTDPNTSENEFKDMIDSRIKDIEDEIFATDLDTPGVRFVSNGGLTGDMARIYLFYGKPHYKAKMSQGIYLAELVVWYYADQDGRPLFRFLFANLYGRLTLFRNYNAMVRWDDLFDPISSPLRHISNRMISSPEDLMNVWEELIRNDIERIFLAALFEFSYYSDINIEEVLQAPEPAALTAEKFKPRIIGEPGDLSGKEMLYGKYHSFIPAYIRLFKSNGNPSLSIIILHQHLDWEIKENTAELKMILNISVINKATAESSRFSSIVTVSLADADKARAVLSVNIIVDDLTGAANGNQSVKFRDFVKALPSGDYIVDIDFFDTRTMKSGVFIKEFTK